MFAADQTLFKFVCKFVKLSIANIQFDYLSKLVSIICMSEVMNISSQTLEVSYIRNHFFCITHFKLLLVNFRFSVFNF